MITEHNKIVDDTTINIKTISLTSEYIVRCFSNDGAFLDARKKSLVSVIWKIVLMNAKARRIIYI